MSLLCSSHEMLSEYCQPLTPIKKDLLRRLLPGPYTFILSANGNVPPALVGEPRKTVGLRIPRHDFCISIANYLNEARISRTVAVITNSRRVKPLAFGIFMITEC